MIVAALKPSAYLGTKVGGGASGATSNLLQTDYRKVRRQKLKKTILICLTMVLVLMVGSLAMAGGNGKTACLVDPPTNLLCSIDFSAETVYCSWDALAGANKYAFEIVFEIPLLADPTATQEVHFDAGTTDTNITVTFAELQAVLDPFGAVLPGQLATAKVKGLNPPQKGACSQANAFAETALDFTLPTL